MSKITKTIFSMIISVVVIVLLGYLIRNIKYNYLETTQITSGLITLCFIVVGCISYPITKAKYTQKKLNKIFEKAKEKNEKLKNNREKTQRKTTRLYFFTLGYYVLVTLTLIVFGASSVAILAISESNILDYLVYVILGIFMLSSIISQLFTTEKVDLLALYLDKEKYIVLYDMLETIKEELNINEEVYLYSDASLGARIITYGDKHHIVLGVLMLELLDQQELKSVLCHELAHILNKDNKKNYKRNKFIKTIYMDEGDFRLSAFSFMFFNGLLNALLVNFRVNKMIQSKQVEIYADGIVKNNDLANEFITSTIKLKYLSLYMNELGHKFYLPIEETPNPTYFKDVIEGLINDFPKRKEIYEFIIENEIESRIPSHPITSSRMKFFGVNTPKIDFDDRYYDNEVFMIINQMNQIDENELDNYQEYRENTYLSRIETIKKYEDNPIDDLQEQLEYGFALFHVMEIEKAFYFFNKLIEKYPTSSHAHNAIGMIYLNYYYNPKGIEHIYKSAELNRNYVDSLDVIGEFCLNMGLKEELEKFRNILTDKIISNIAEYDNIGDINPSTRLFPATLEKEKLNEIIDYIKNQDFATEVFIVRKNITDDFYAHLVCIVANEANGFDFNTAMNNIFNHLDIREEQFALIHVNNQILYKKLKKVSNPYILNK
ncbi:M48 family metalloprotease [Haploplasma axanthum]|uniref:Heat shock protein HtpX n=1 Tax=Haploplasma axanthum TaxID=29552 RepID=A0A449BDV9_HAPAX|nr:M48 family metalloprotease [Haploplasma axanthum]VEU80618.1 heat shock protein HtpX [Haploplasma axanthum]